MEATQNKYGSRRIWTTRHWYPIIAGSISSGVYALTLRTLGQTVIFQHYYQLQGWEIPITAQAALFLGAYFTRKMMFDK